MSVDDVSPYEAFDLGVFNACVGVCFDPFWEEIRQNQQEPFLFWPMHGSDYVHRPSHERIWCWDRWEDLCRLMDSRGVPLALFAFSCKVQAVFNHCWPIVSVACDFDCEGPSTRLISAWSRVDLFHYLSCFLLFYTGHERSRKSPLVEFFVNQDVPCGLGFNLSGRPFFCWEFPVSDVCKDRLCPRFVESLFRLLGILYCLDIDFVDIAVGWIDQIYDDKRPDARILYEFHGNYPGQTRIWTGRQGV